MNSNNITDPDLYNFPISEPEQAGISWLGKNYVKRLTDDLSEIFNSQAPGTKLIALKQESDPSIETIVSKDGKVTKAKAEFDLQCLLKDPTGKDARLYFTFIYKLDNGDVSRALKVNRAN